MFNRVSSSNVPNSTFLCIMFATLLAFHATSFLLVIFQKKSLRLFHSSLAVQSLTMKRLCLHFIVCLFISLHAPEHAFIIIQ